MNAGTLLTELKRRNVYKVAVAYAVVGWLSVQVATQVFPFLEIPNWVVRFVIALVAIGFPIALVIAWAFEATPERLRRTEVADAMFATRAQRKHAWIYIVIIGAAISAALFFLGRYTAGNKLPAPDAEMNAKSIAVLPFENFSDEKESGYFGDGIQDDILTNLAKVADLKVISRTSVAQYRGKTENLREIGKALGVATILEGSVRKAGNRVRVNVQLINAETDQHIWAEDYDRELTDVFAIQTDLAQKIAAQLHAKLSPSEKATLTQPPTANGEAYLAYIQAHNLRYEYDDPEKAKAVEQLYARAMELDPKFALAIAGQSLLQSRIYRWNDSSNPSARRARELADQALALQPDLPEAHLALGTCHYYLERDPGHYERALKEIEIAREGLPNDAEVYISLANVERRMGKWNGSIANNEKAHVLDPKNQQPLDPFTYLVLRDWNGARRMVERGLKLDSIWHPLFWFSSERIAIAERGDFSVGDKVLAEMARAPAEIRDSPAAVACRGSMFMSRRKWAEALREWESVADRIIAGFDLQTPGETYAAIGVCKRELGDDGGAHVAFLKAVEWNKRALADTPYRPVLLQDYTVSLALLGEKEAALTEAKRAVELVPESADALGGTRITAALAQVYAVTGEADKAVDLLAHLLEVPSEITPWVLKLSPDWDALRGNPRFEQLVARAP